jgi:single-strand DNA-binding protein
VTRDSQKHSLAEYHELVAWANLAEICGKYLRKGKLIYVEGYLKTRSWDTPEGIRRHKTEIVIHDMIMLEKRPKGEEGADYVPSADDFFEEPSKDEPPKEGASKAKEEEKKEEAPAEEPKEEKKKSDNPIDDEAIEF